MGPIIKDGCVLPTVTGFSIELHQSPIPKPQISSSPEVYAERDLEHDRQVGYLKSRYPCKGFQLPNVLRAQKTKTCNEPRLWKLTTSKWRVFLNTKSRRMDGQDRPEGHIPPSLCGWGQEVPPLPAEEVYISSSSTAPPNGLSLAFWDYILGFVLKS